MRRAPRRASARPKLPVRATLRRVAADYRARWRLLLAGAITVFVPLSAIEALEREVEALEVGGNGLAVTGVALLVAVTLAASTLGNQVYAGLVGEAAAQLRSAGRPSLVDVMRALPYRRLVAIDLLVTLAVGGGLLLLVVPGVLAFGWLALAAPLSTIEDLGVRGAFRRSRQLVRGSFWRVVLVLASLLLATEAGSELLQAGAGTVAGDGWASDWLGASIANVLLAPILALATVVMAYELIGLEARPRRTSGT